MSGASVVDQWWHSARPRLQTVTVDDEQLSTIIATANDGVLITNSAGQ
jgi:hypothetical protein